MGLTMRRAIPIHRVVYPTLRWVLISSHNPTRAGTYMVVAEVFVIFLWSRTSFLNRLSLFHQTAPNSYHFF